MIEMTGQTSLTVMRYIVPVVEMKKKNSGMNVEKLKSQYTNELQFGSRNLRREVLRRTVEINKEQP